jgi:invasion protein IalB
MTIDLARAARLAAVAMIGTAAIAVAAPALAQTERVAAHTDWSVFTPSDPRECYIASPPTSSVARRGDQVVEVNRGEIRLFVTWRPEENVRGEVSFASGYPFREGSNVRVEVGNETFLLGTGTGNASGWAWPESPEEDARLVAAFRRGSTAKVIGESARGNRTEDTFSLMGFTAAYNDAENRCR